MNAPDGRTIFVWRGLDPDDDTARLTDAIAEKAITKLFTVDGSVCLFSEGQTLPVTRPILLEIITKIIAGVRLVPHEPAPGPRIREEAGGTFKVEYFSFDFPIGGDLTKGPNDRTLANILEKLITLVAKGPQEPLTLSPQRQQEVRDRLKIGERPDALARAYNVDIETIKRVVS